MPYLLFIKSPALSHFKRVRVISVLIRGVADFNLPSNKRGWGCVIMNKIYYNDFFCSKLKLAIELDGYTHEKEHTP
jgi:hypothetical protein